MAKNENIKSMSLILIDDIKETLMDIRDGNGSANENVTEVERLLAKLKKGIEKIS